MPHDILEALLRKQLEVDSDPRIAGKEVEYVRTQEPCRPIAGLDRLANPYDLFPPEPRFAHEVTRFELLIGYADEAANPNGNQPANNAASEKERADLNWPREEADGCEQRGRDKTHEVES